MKITEQMIEVAAKAFASAQNIIPEITREERLGTALPSPFKIMRYAMGHEITEWHRAVVTEVLQAALLYDFYSSESEVTNWMALPRTK